MGKIIALFAMITSINVFACDDLELLDRTIKTDIYYQYAPFGKMEVAKDHVMAAKVDGPHRLTINFKEKPYKITILFDIKRSSIGDQKIVDLTYKFENTEDGKTYENAKLVKLVNGKKKVGIYDWIHGRKMIFVFKDFSDTEWSEMTCPYLPTEENKEI